MILVVLLALLAAACGDDDTGTSEATAAPSSSTEATAAPSTTAATTTTAAPTTTSTTVPADAHPALGVSWAAVLPDPDARAVYRVDDFGIQGDLQARMEYGAEFNGGTYDRFVLGLDTPDTPGLAFYFDLSEPWVVAFIGLAVFPSGTAAGKGPEVVETFAEPAAFDLSGGPGETYHLEGNVTSQFGSGAFDNDIVVDITLRDADAGPVTVAAGTFGSAVVYDIVVSGPFMGGDFPIEYTLSADNLVLMVSMAGASVELLEPWG